MDFVQLIFGLSVEDCDYLRMKIETTFQVHSVVVKILVISTNRKMIEHWLSCKNKVNVLLISVSVFAV